MPFQKGNPGKPKGATHHRSRTIEEIAARFDIDPFEVLMWVAAGDWQALGEAAPIKLSDRVAAAKEAAKYLYSQKQSVAISTGDSGIKIIVEDYTKKE